MSMQKIVAGALPAGESRRFPQATLRWAAAAALAWLLALAWWGAAFAQGLPGTLVDGPAGFSVLTPNAEPVDPAAFGVTADDGGQWELGVEGTAGNLPAATAAERAGMWFWLNGWFVRRFSYDESTAWEEDFKRASLGGTENNYLDRVDLMFYVGHGSPGQISFDNAAHDDWAMTSPGDCDTSWGDVDNEWLAMTSCQVLDGAGLSNMALCMNRQHLILGFVTNASAHNNVGDTQAYHFGRYMRFGYNMTQAWFKACDVADRGRTVRVIAEETACFNDNPYYSSVCADFYDNDYYWYTHSCGTPGAGVVPDALLQGVQLPVIKLAEYTEADAKGDFAHLIDVFTATLTSAAAMAPVGPMQENPPVPPPPAGSPFLFSNANGQVLQLDQNSGLYEYSNLNQLWTGEIADLLLNNQAAVAASVNAIDQRTYIAAARSFLGQNLLLPANIGPAEVATDFVGGSGRADALTAAEIDQREIPASVQVIFPRQIPVTAVTTAGAIPVDLTVVGPGAKLKVYYPTALNNTVVTADALQSLVPSAVQGGWRELADVDLAAGAAPMVTTLPEDTIKALYLALDDLVAMNSIPISITARTIISASLAYWEGAPGAQQGELIPVYELNVEITEADTGSMSMMQIYVPASNTYLKPIAIILPAVQVAAAQDALIPGVQVTLTAADASQTLEALGLGAAFNFVAGTNGAATNFSYDWYLGDPIPPNKIPGCSTTSCTFRVPMVSPDKGGQFAVTLVVTDQDSPNVSQGVDSSSFEVLPVAGLLPVVKKNAQ